MGKILEFFGLKRINDVVDEAIKRIEKSTLYDNKYYLWSEYGKKLYPNANIDCYAKFRLFETLTELCENLKKDYKDKQSVEKINKIVFIWKHISEDNKTIFKNSLTEQEKNNFG